MKVTEFDRLSKRDFENGAVLNEIRRSLHLNDELLEACEIGLDFIRSSRSYIKGEQWAVHLAFQIREAIKKAETTTK